ncbi:MAG: hypothetical protein AMXMBFR53_40480 [Gemmatimonadota bacterium]
MDGAKAVAKLVVAVGLVWVFPGPQVAALFSRPDLSLTPPAPAPLPVDGGAVVPPYPANLTANGWLQQAKPFCNAVEVVGYLRANPFPSGEDGAAHAAACLALAGLVDDARRLILELPSDARWRAAGVVFEAGHPAADAGDDLAAGPLMELVVEFWPNHYMALYHAGAACYERGEAARARDYLERFLAEYHADDGWTGSARGMLEELAKRDGGGS